MEGGTFRKDSIQEEFGRFVEIVLHTDGTNERFGPSSAVNRGILKDRFGTSTIPFYAVLDPTGEKVLWSKGGVISEEEFLAGLRKAVKQP